PFKQHRLYEIEIAFLEKEFIFYNAELKKKADQSAKHLDDIQQFGESFVSTMNNKKVSETCQIDTFTTSELAQDSIFGQYVTKAENIRLEQIALRQSLGEIVKQLSTSIQETMDLSNLNT